MYYKLAHSEPIDAIAISGMSGCGNTTVNKLLAKRLQWNAVNYTMRNYAEETRIPFAEIAQKAETDETIDLQIDQRQIEIALKGRCILSSRLAIWLLPKAVLRVYLKASPETRARRIFERESPKNPDLTIPGTLETTKLRDQRDQERYRRLYQIQPDGIPPVDLVIDTETFSPDQICELISHAYQIKT